MHEKVVRALALATLPSNAYDDSEIGPLKPGYDVYQWLLHGPPLQLPIAETYLCHRGGGVTVIRTDPTTGYLLKERHVLTAETTFEDESEVDVGFVRACVDRVVAHAAPLIQLPSIYNLPLQAGHTAGSGPRHAETCVDRPLDALSTYQRPTRHERLQHRFVAVLKRPLFNPRAAAVANGAGGAVSNSADAADDSDDERSADGDEEGDGGRDEPYRNNRRSSVTGGARRASQSSPGPRQTKAAPLAGMKGEKPLPPLVVATETELLQVRPIQPPSNPYLPHIEPASCPYLALYRVPLSQSCSRCASSSPT